jgi:hypothetical protein
MRLAPLLIIEGRKEDLRKKYKSKFSADPEHIEVLDYALGHPFLAQTNFKYGDFLLRNLHPNSSIEEIIDDIELIKEFDRFQQSLEEYNHTNKNQNLTIKRWIPKEPKNYMRIPTF